MNTKFTRNSFRTIFVVVTIIATLVMTSGTVLVAAASDYNLKSPYEPLQRDLRATARQAIDTASARKYAQLRERSVKKAPPVLKIHSAIEALVLSIESLPGKAAARIAEQVPTEYLVSSEDMAAEMGHPVLPVIDLTPQPAEETKAPAPRARRQLA